MRRSSQGIWTPVCQVERSKNRCNRRTRLSGSSAEGSKGADPVLMYVDARPRPYLVWGLVPPIPHCQRLQERPIIAVVRESIAYSILYVFICVCIWCLFIMCAYVFGWPHGSITSNSWEVSTQIRNRGALCKIPTAFYGAMRASKSCRNRLISV